MKKNQGAVPEPDIGNLDAGALCASFSGTTYYAVAVTAALLEETMRWIEQWCSMSARLYGAGLVPAFAYSEAHASVSTLSRAPDPLVPTWHGADIHPEPGVADAFEDDDLPRITDEEMLANPLSMEFNIALHDMQEQLFSGQFVSDHPYALPPADNPGLRSWLKEKKTEPSER